MKVAMLVRYDGEFESIREIGLFANKDLATVARDKLIKDRKLAYPMQKYMHFKLEDFEIFDEEVIDEPQED